MQRLPLVEPLSDRNGLRINFPSGRNEGLRRFLWVFGSAWLIPLAVTLAASIFDRNVLSREFIGGSAGLAILGLAIYTVAAHVATQRHELEIDEHQVYFRRTLFGYRLEDHISSSQVASVVETAQSDNPDFGIGLGLTSGKIKPFGPRLLPLERIEIVEAVNQKLSSLRGEGETWSTEVFWAPALPDNSPKNVSTKFITHSTTDELTLEYSGGPTPSFVWVLLLLSVACFVIGGCTAFRLQSALDATEGFIMRAVSVIGFLLGIAALVGLVYIGTVRYSAMIERSRFKFTHRAFGMTFNDTRPTALLYRAIEVVSRDDETPANLSSALAFEFMDGTIKKIGFPGAKGEYSAIVAEVNERLLDWNGWPILLTREDRRSHVVNE